MYSLNTTADPLNIILCPVEQPGPPQSPPTQPTILQSAIILQL